MASSPPSPNTEPAEIFPSNRQPPKIPPPPPAAMRKGQKSQRAFLVVIGGFIVGVSLGAVAYVFVPGVDVQFDDWLALAIGQ